MAGVHVTEWQDDGDVPLHRINLATMEMQEIASCQSHNAMWSVFSWSSVLKILKQTFLPIGFPRSTPPDYLSYQFWNLLQDLCSYLRGIMATRAVLIGMGVGRAEVTAYQATIQWLLRDGAGLIGGLMFTSLSSYNFGQNVKIWRLFADMINNVGITLDMLAPMLSYHNCALVLCVASVCKALCGIAAGATGAAINAHFGSLHNNNADIMAKNGAQHNIVTLLGLGMSIWLAKAADEASPRMIWLIYIFLTLIHIYSNYRAMRVLSLRSINIVRYELLIDRFLSSPVLSNILTSPVPKMTISQALFDEVARWASALDTQQRFSPTSIAQSEPILRLLLTEDLRRQNTLSIRNAPYRNLCKVHMWSSLNQVLGKSNMNSTEKEIILKQLHQQLQNPYVLITLHREHNSKRSTQIYVFISKQATSEDIAKAYFEVELHRICQDESIVKSLVNGLFPILWDSLKKNLWMTDRILLKPFGASSFDIDTKSQKKAD